MGFFIVLGLGKFGTALALFLKERGNEVLAVDENQALVNSLKGQIDEVVAADIKEKEVLAQLGVKDADAVIVAVGGSIETSILCTQNLIDLNVKNIYAKVKTEEHAKILKALGMEEKNLIFPERDSAKRLAEHLSIKNILDVIPLEDDYIIAMCGVPNSFLGQTLRQLDIRKKYNVQIIGIKDVLARKWEFVPSPDFILKDSDELMVIGREGNVKKFLNLK